MHGVAELVAVEQVVAQDERSVGISYEVLADEECLRDPTRARLLCVGERKSPLGAVAKQVPEIRQIVRRRDYEDVLNAAHHQSGEGIVDERFVKHRQQLFTYCAGDWV